MTEGNEMARRSMCPCAGLHILVTRNPRLTDPCTEMNARMRRIDLFCKLIGPLTISLVAIASTEIAIYTTLAMNVASVLVEYVCIEQVRHLPLRASRYRPR